MGRTEEVKLDIRTEFQRAGFEVANVGQAPERIEVRKINCSRVLERQAGGAWVPAGPPRFMVRGLMCELEDRGFQKYWLSGDKRFPIRAGDLRTLHSFDEELRAILGLKSLYNESLGSTSARTVYDRLAGRPDR
jgi:hypothetical protein